MDFKQTIFNVCIITKKLQKCVHNLKIKENILKSMLLRICLFLCVYVYVFDSSIISEMNVSQWAFLVKLQYLEPDSIENNTISVYNLLLMMIK